MGKPIVAAGTVGVLETGWRDTLLVCRKCSKKLDGEGFGADGSDGLRSALRAGLRERGQRGSVRIVETACMGVCPKRAVVVVRGSRPEAMLVVGVGADVGAVLDRFSPALGG